MDLMGPVVLSVGAFLAAWWLTGRVRRYALERQLFDVPNARSSHSVATPRGGGIAIVLITLATFLLAGLLGVLNWPHIWGLLGGGAVAAAIGFVDDHRHIARRWRLLAHVVAAIWVLAWLGGMPPVGTLGVVVDLGWLGHVLAAVYLVWVLNLTNFMDGIDGIAALEVLTVCLSGVVLYLVAAPGEDNWTAPLILAMATLGFLVWNWPPAKIFMGDAGSGFLGLMLAALSLQAAWAAPRLFWSWVILLGVFIVDATVTLVRRMVRRERFYEAHRTHAYQHAAQRYGAHKPATLAVAAINMIWLLPLALLVSRNSLDGLIGVLVAYAPLAAAAVWLGAGVHRSSPAGHSGAHV